MRAVAEAVVSVVFPATLSVCARVRPPVDEAEAKKSWPPIVAAPVVEAVERVARPDWLTEKREAPVDEATTNGLAPATPLTERVAIGEEEPIPRRVLVLSQKKLALFCDTRPLVPMNGIEPAVSPER